MAGEQAIGMADRESMGMPGQPAIGLGFPALLAVHGRVARAVDGGGGDGMRTDGVGHLYMQTNEIRNCVIQYQRSADGTITEAEHCYTGENSTSAGAG